MAIKNWPKPARRAFGYLLVGLSLLMAFGPLWLLLGNGELWLSLNSTGQVFGSYAAIITLLTTIVATTFVYWRARRRIDRILGTHILFGAVVGFVIGVFMIPVTVGVSLAIAPAAGIVTSVVALILRSMFPEGRSRQDSR